MDHRDAAIYLRVSDERFAALMTRPEFAAAYLEGRRTTIQRIHARLIDGALDGNPSLIREALRRLEDEPPAASPAPSMRDHPDARPGDDAPAIPVVDDFAAAYQRLMTSRGKAVG